MWKESMALVSDVYRATSSYPSGERYGLAQQLRRASISIPSNIAEGAGRQTSGDFARFLRMALGSTCEAETQVDLSLDLGFIDRDLHQHLRSSLDRISVKLRSLHNHFSSHT